MNKTTTKQGSSPTIGTGDVSNRNGFRAVRTGHRSFSIIALALTGLLAGFIPEAIAQTTAGPAERILSFDSEISVQANATVNVRETIRVRALW